MEKFGTYLEDKSEILKKMDFVEEKFKALNEIGIDCSEPIHKIQKAKAIISADRISLVLVGSFSDGKTTVASGLLNQTLEKIDTDESSDEILTYSAEGISKECVIYDTPGLFGNKEGADESGKKIRLSEKTKKYISEANLILYVVEAKNPIKDTHKETVKWILKDLNKLSTTIFVINKMDDVADLTDKNDFTQQAKIKIDNLKAKLADCGLTNTEVDSIRVVCVSADPDEKGVSFWNSHRQVYYERSNLAELETATTSVLTDTKDIILSKTGCDVLNYELANTKKGIEQREADIKEVFMPEMKETIKRNQKDYEQLKQRLKRNKIEMQNEIAVLEKKKISAIRSTTLETFKNVMEDEIGVLEGKEGYRLDYDLNQILQSYAEKANSQIMATAEKFQAEYDKRNELAESLFKKGASAAAEGLKGAGKLGTNALKSGIFAGRNLLGKVGIVVKFKPWQVTKMAAFATKALPIIGAGIDVVSNIIENFTEQKRNKKFKEQQVKIIKGIEEIFYEIQNQLKDDEQYFKDFCPTLIEMEKQLKTDEDDYKEQELLLKKFEEWKRDFEDVTFIVHD